MRIRKYMKTQTEAKKANLFQTKLNEVNVEKILALNYDIGIVKKFEFNGQNT